MMLTPAERLKLLYEAQEKNAGIASVTADGVTITYNRQQLAAEIAVLEKQIAKSSGKRPVVARIKMTRG